MCSHKQHNRYPDQVIYLLLPLLLCCEIIEIDRANDRAKVKDLNMIKKHVKTTKEKKGGIFSKENFIHISNLKLVNEKKKTKKPEAKK